MLDLDILVSTVLLLQEFRIHKYIHIGFVRSFRIVVCYYLPRILMTFSPFYKISSSLIIGPPGVSIYFFFVHASSFIFHLNSSAFLNFHFCQPVLPGCNVWRDAIFTIVQKYDPGRDGQQAWGRERERLSRGGESFTNNISYIPSGSIDSPIKKS